MVISLDGCNDNVAVMDFCGRATKVGIKTIYNDRNRTILFILY